MIFREQRCEIFISYKREDAAGWAESIYQLLKDYYGPNIVFKDEEETRTETDWPARLARLVITCKAFVLIIGPEWADSRIITKLNDETNWVHKEIVTAIDAHRPIFPVVIEGTSVPTYGIPEKISQVLNRKRFVIRRNAKFWQGDIERLCKDIENEAGVPWPGVSTPQNAHHADGKEQVLRNDKKRLPWRIWFAQGIRIVVVTTVLLMLVLGGWIVTRWGLDELTASATVTRDPLLCEVVPRFGPEMIPVEGGPFQMGVDPGSTSNGQRPVHTVTIKPFAIGTCEVTFGEYDRFAQATKRELPDDHGWGRGRRPVINVSWQDAKDYAEWLSRQTGKRYRLLTEAEWEYAVRSGGKDEMWAGTSDEKVLQDYAVFRTDRTELVASKKPNGLGLYDMSGNVWEWAEDCSDVPKEQSNCGARVVRGGSWYNEPVYLRAAYRIWNYAVTRSNSVGFRLAQDNSE